MLGYLLKMSDLIVLFNTSEIDDERREEETNSEENSHYLKWGRELY